MTTILSEAVVVSSLSILPDPQTEPSLKMSQAELEFVLCECCGLKEECTQAYIDLIRDRYNGNWICGLCAEVIKDEIVKSQRLLLIISTEEAMIKHMNYCKMIKSFASAPPPNPTVPLISVMKHILRRRSLSSKSRVNCTNEVA